MPKGRKQPEQRSASKGGIGIGYVDKATGKTTMLKLKDSSLHRIPADEALVISAPPSRQGAFAGLGEWGGRHSRPTDEELKEEAIDATVASMEAAHLIAEDVLNAASGKPFDVSEPFQAFDVLGHVDMISVADPQRLVATLQSCRSWAELRGKFRDWPRTPRLFKFADMTESQLDAMGRWPTPVTASGYLVMLSNREYWLAYGVKADHQEVVIHELFANIRPEASDVRADNASRRIALTMLQAGAEAGDLYTLLTVGASISRDAALARKRPDIHATAVQTYMPLLLRASHTTAVQDVCYFSTVCGEMFEMASERGVPGAARSAILAYKCGAEFVSQPKAFVASGYYQYMWNNLGLALKRAGEFDMAERAYLWGLAVPRPLRRPEACGEDMLASIRSHLVNNDKARSKTPSEQARDAAWGIGMQCWSARPAVCGLSESCGQCAACGISSFNVRSVCKGCRMVKYCDQDCQKAHWPHHKKWCKEQQKKMAASRALAD